MSKIKLKANESGTGILTIEAPNTDTDKTLTLPTSDGTLVTTDGTTFTGNVNFGDSDKAQFGASQDLQIYHDGSHSRIRDTGTGDLRIHGTNVFIRGQSTDSNLAGFVDGGASSLFYNGSTKLATTSTGIDVTGSVVCDDIVPSTQLSHRNLIINGAMQVAQRGTTASVTDAATQNIYPTVDRFNLFRDGSSNSDFDISQEDDAPPESGCFKSLKIQTTATDTVGTRGCRWYQRIEQQDCRKLNWGTSGAKNVTLSFWVKSSTTGQGGVTLLTQQGGSLSYLYAKLYTITTANTWQKITMTFEGNTAGSEFTDAVTEGMRIEWWMDSGTIHDDGTTPADEWITYNNGKRGRDITLDLMGTVGNNFYLTGCQLEVGSVATPFEHRSYGEELARCQRYYWRDINNEVSGGANLRHYVGYADSTTATITPVRYPVRMRTNPTLNISGTWSTESSSTADLSSYSLGANTTYVGQIQSTSSASFTTKGYAVGIRSSDTSAYVEFDAEL